MRLVNTASRAYLLAMHLLEQRAFFLKTGSWAKKWKRSGKEPSEIKAWLKDPSSTDKLTTALVDMVVRKIKTSRKRVKDADGGDSDSPGSKSSSGASGIAAASSSDWRTQGKLGDDIQLHLEQKRTQDDETAEWCWIYASEEVCQPYSARVTELELA